MKLSSTATAALAASSTSAAPTRKHGPSVWDSIARQARNTILGAPTEEVQKWLGMEVACRVHETDTTPATDLLQSAESANSIDQKAHEFHTRSVTDQISYEEWGELKKMLKVHSDLYTLTSEGADTLASLSQEIKPQLGRCVK